MTLIEHIKYLSVSIGPRGATTDAERRASEYIKSEFEKNGLHTTVETFTSPPTFSYVYGIIFFTSLLSIYFLISNLPALAFLLSAFSSIALYLENNSYELISKIVPRGVSQNVIARHDINEGVKKRIILSAHYDSSKWSLTNSPSLVKGFKSSFKLILASILSIPLLSIIVILSTQSFFAYISILPGLIMGFAILLLLHREIVAGYVDGAGDNASGAAILLTLSRRFMECPLKNISLTFLATGSEEAGLFGMIDFLKRHPKEARDSLIINMDNLGSGGIKYITSEGMTRIYSSDHDLIEYAEKAANKLPELSIKPAKFTTMSTDAIPALARGYRAMSVMALKDDELVPEHWHWITDKFENVDEGVVKGAEEFVSEMITLLDEKEDRS